MVRNITAMYSVVHKIRIKLTYHSHVISLLGDIMLYYIIVNQYCS